jgi:short-subunit dehydrogenase
MSLQTNVKVIITGASSGLGKAIALHYAKYFNAELFLIGRNSSNLEITAEECRELGAKDINFAVDVTDLKALNAALDNIKEVDFIYTNAAISAGTAGGFEGAEQVKNIINTNVIGVTNLIETIIPKINKNGRVVIISSLASQLWLPSAPAYSTSKMAVYHYGSALRLLLEDKKIGVSVVFPGFIDTNMTKKNNFYMPFLMEVGQAAAKIVNEVSKGKNEIFFPWQVFMIIRLIKLLPNFIINQILKLLPRK